MWCYYNIYIICIYVLDNLWLPRIVPFLYSSRAQPESVGSVSLTTIPSVTRCLVTYLVWVTDRIYEDYSAFWSFSSVSVYQNGLLCCQEDSLRTRATADIAIELMIITFSPPTKQHHIEKSCIATNWGEREATGITRWDSVIGMTCSRFRPYQLQHSYLVRLQVDYCIFE